MILRKDTQFVNFLASQQKKFKKMMRKKFQKPHKNFKKNNHTKVIIVRTEKDTKRVIFTINQF